MPSYELPLFCIKFSGFTEVLNTINNIIAYRKTSGAYIPVINKEIINKAHFDTQI
jgi:hypothetical protein